MIISICIATYKREKLLSRLLDSILLQKLEDDIILQVIVVDNDIDKSAEGCLEKYQDVKQIKFEYHTQPEKNISLTRNIAVANSRGKYLLFIDDDEEADKNWIISYIKTIKKFKADGVFGPVIPIFHDNTPNWMKESELFSKKCPPTGEPAIFTRTSNCIIRAELIKTEEAPFDPAYGITGGEDSHLFTRLKREGARFISSREAIVSEYIPPERTKVRWLFKKAFQTGNTVTRRMIENAKNKFRKRMELLVRSIIFEILSAILFVVFFPSKKTRTNWLMKMASNAGHIAAITGINYKGYK